MVRMFPRSMASFGALLRFRISTISRSCMLCSSQNIINTRRNISLSSRAHERDKDDKILKTSEDKHPKYQKQDVNPFERTFNILRNDIVEYFTAKKYAIQKLKREADEKFESEQDKIKKNVYNFDEREFGKHAFVWPRHCDVLVVGGGAVGSSIAYHIKEKARDGLNVVVVEEDTTYKKASTVLSVGGIRQQFSLPENIQLSLYGMEFLRNSQELLEVEGLETPDIQFNPNGYLTLASEQGYEQLEENYKLQVDLGAKVSLLTDKQLSSMYPWLNTSGVVAGVVGRENEGWFDPWSLLIGIQRKSIALGANYVHGKVTGFTSELPDDYVLEGTHRSNIKRLLSAEVMLPNGETHSIDFSTVILACGAWTGEVSRLVGIGEGSGILSVPIPIEPRKRYVYCVHAPDGPGLNTPLVVDPNGTYFRREGLGGLYLCGQSPSHDKEPTVDNLDVDYSFFEDEVWPSIAHRAPGFEKLKLHSSWAGYYDYNTFDQNGIIGLHPLISNMFIASGFSGHGIQQAPGVGRAIMECIIYGNYTTIDLERFGFERILGETPLYESNIV